MVALDNLRDFELEAGGWVVQKWQFQGDVIFEEPHLKNATLLPSSQHSTCIHQ